MEELHNLEDLRRIRGIYQEEGGEKVFCFVDIVHFMKVEQLWRSH